MAKNFYDSPWSYVLALLTGIPFPAFKDAVTDEYGANAVDREFVAYLKRMVEKGEITEEEARKRLADKGYEGKGTSDEFYDSVGSDVGKGIEIGNGSGAATGIVDGIAGVLQSLIAYYTRNDLTGAEREMNEFSAGEAQKSRDFTEYMARNKYSMETQSMQDAGVNPAMVYGGGNLVPTASNGAAATSSSIGAGSIVDLLSTMVRMPLEMKRLNAEIKSQELDNKLKEKDLDWYDKKAGAGLENLSADTQTKIKSLEEADSRIRNNEMDTDLKRAQVSTEEARQAVEWAKYVQIGLSNELQEQLNPLLVQAQEYENELKRVESEYRERQILAALAETRAKTAALYAQAALDGARKQGVDIENKIKGEDVKFAVGNAQNRANLLRWTAYSTREGLRQAKYQTKNSQYYSEHYQEAFRNSWSQSGVEWGITQSVGEAIGNLSMLGLMLAY